MFETDNSFIIVMIHTQNITEAPALNDFQRFGLVEKQTESYWYC